MNKFYCPYCYEYHSIKDCEVKCLCKTCPEGVERERSGIVPPESRKKCLSCRNTAVNVYCANDSKKLVPRACLDNDSLSIALLGAKGSGKSNYIGVVVEEIRRKMTQAFRCTISMTADPDTKKYYNEFYYKPLFVKKKVVRGTDGGEIPPLVFPIDFTRKNKTFVMTFYDTAGENFDGIDKMQINNRYIPGANGLIVLIDPMQIPSIRDKLKGKVTLPPESKDAIYILDAVIENIYGVRRRRGQIKVPLAVVLTKIDVLEEYGVLPTESCLRRESEHLREKAFVKSEFSNTNIETRDLLDTLVDSELRSKMDVFSDSAFFGVSSLGKNPQTENLSTPTPEPRRVLDPILWILSKNNYIRQKK